MALNITTTPTYDLVLPASKKKVKYRPFVVREEKVLLLAMQEGEENIIHSMVNVMNECTFGTIKVETLPTADAEFLFMHVRNKAMGEGVDLVATCTHCAKKNSVQADLSKLTVTEGAKDNKVVLRDGLSITMKYPTLAMATNLSKDETDAAIQTIAKCIEFIEDNGKLIDCADHSIKEIVEFVENFTQGQMNEVDKFFESVPKVSFDMKYKCIGCQAENNIHLEGIEDFFA